MRSTWSEPRAGGDVALDAVGEEHRADAIVVRDGGEREHRGELGGEVALDEELRAETLRARDVDDAGAGSRSRSSTNFFT